jgi:Spy/CpxP family protein refolding chaperone
MTPRSKKTAAAVGGALVLASGAYALGTQTGDGTALAGGKPTPAKAGAPPGPGRHGGPRDLSGIAAKLGVTEAKLRAAMEKIRPDLEKQHEAERDALIAKLAAKLGVSEAKVKDVIGSEPHHGRRGP